MKKTSTVITFLLGVLINFHPLYAQSQTALSFDGVDDHVTIGNNLGFEYTDQFTIEAWIKTNGT